MKCKFPMPLKWLDKQSRLIASTWHVGNTKDMFEHDSFPQQFNSTVIHFLQKMETEHFIFNGFNFDRLVHQNIGNSKRVSTSCKTVENGFLPLTSESALHKNCKNAFTQKMLPRHSRNHSLDIIFIFSKIPPHKHTPGKRSYIFQAHLDALYKLGAGKRFSCPRLHLLHFRKGLKDRECWFGAEKAIRLLL